MPKITFRVWPPCATWKSEADAQEWASGSARCGTNLPSSGDAAADPAAVSKNMTVESEAASGWNPDARYFTWCVESEERKPVGLAGLRGPAEDLP